jgi:hypothetical protein
MPAPFQVLHGAAQVLLEGPDGGEQNRTCVFYEICLNFLNLKEEIEMRTITMTLQDEALLTLKGG